MPRATYNHTTPEPRATRYVRATRPLTVELHQPIAPGQVRTITGRVLGEMRVNGCLHHYRVVNGDGVLLLVPPEWVRQVDAPKPVRAVVSTNLMRRHLDTSQRAMIAARFATLANGGDRTSVKQTAKLPTASSVEDAALLVNVSPRSVGDARTVLASASPETIAKVERPEVFA